MLRHITSRTTRCFSRKAKHSSPLRFSRLHAPFPRRAFSSSTSGIRYGRWILLTLAGGAVYLCMGGPRLHYPDAQLMVQGNQDREMEEEIETVPQVKFVHPYENSSWFWRMYFKTKRTIFLCVLFAPCAAISLIAAVTESPIWRQYWLDALVKTFEYAGCSFQKFGQIITMRPDMFPADVIKALSTLRDKVPEHDFRHTQRMIRESFGFNIEDIFEEFDVVPVASGTVAQVHRARLRPDFASKSNMLDKEGNPVREVAVKVRHPHVLDETWLDIDLIFSVVNSTTFFTVPFCKEEFLEQLQKQVNFEVEARNLQRFANNFHSEVGAGKLWFPSVSSQLLSPSILVESWAPGRALSEILSDVGDGFKTLGHKANEFGEEMIQKKQELAHTVFDMTFKMFFRDNLVHGDLHSGNVMYDSEGSCCTVIDAGLTTSIGEDIQGSFQQFIYALSTGDGQVLLDKLLEFNVSEVKLTQEAKNDLKQAVEQACDKWVSPSGHTAPDGGPISLGDLIGGILFALNSHDVTLRGDVANSMLTLGVSEGLVRSLDPDFDVVKSALPYFVHYGIHPTGETETDFGNHVNDFLLL